MIKFFSPLFILLSLLSNMAFANSSDKPYQVTKSPGYYAGVPGHGPFLRKQCNEIDILERVCGLGGANTPQLVDPTGIEPTLEDLKLRQKNRLVFEKKELPLNKVGLVSDEGYEAFKVAYEMVKQGFSEIIEQLPTQEASHFKARLDLFELISKKDLNKTLQSYNITTLHKTASVVNAYYNIITKKIVFYPSLLNEPRRSKAGIAAILAHEMAHYMDPKVQLFGGLTGKYIFRFWYDERKNFVGHNLDTCFENSFADHTPTTEDWADWLASLVIDKLVQKYETHLERQRFAQNAFKFFCGKVNYKSSILTKILRFGVPHSLARDRIIYFYRQPHLRDALDCEGLPIEKDVLVPQCTL